MYKLKYLKFGNTLCGSDFDANLKVEYINLKQISSISGINAFYAPISGNLKGNYSIISMNNGDRFAIKEDEFEKIMKKFEL